MQLDLIIGFTWLVLKAGALIVCLVTFALLLDFLLFPQDSKNNFKG